MEIIARQEIIADERFRKDYGDVSNLVASVREFGIIQPLVLSRVDGQVKLVAGGRRLKALEILRVDALRHGIEFVWREELSQDFAEVKYRLKAVELEENLRRKDMEWGEQVAAKAELLRLMQSIHGPAVAGGLTREERRTGVTQGFGVRKLAAMLGESPAQVSTDLQLAAAIAVVPQLKQETSKKSAFAKVAAMVAKITGQALPQVPSQIAKPLEYRVLIFCQSEKHQVDLMQRFADEGLKCQAVIV